MVGERLGRAIECSSRLNRIVAKSFLLFISLAFAVGFCNRAASADTPLACRQLGPVSGTATPSYSADTSDVQIVVGDHYWACPCGETRHIVGDSEQRKIVGDSEQRKNVGDSEQRKIVGDSEQRKIVGDSEQRKIVGDSEQRKIVGDSEQRRIVGDASGLQCRRDPGCTGFVLLGATISGIKVVARDGIRPAQASCIVPY